MCIVYLRAQTSSPEHIAERSCRLVSQAFISSKGSELSQRPVVVVISSICNHLNRQIGVNGGSQPIATCSRYDMKDNLTECIGDSIALRLSVYHTVAQVVAYMD